MSQTTTQAEEQGNVATIRGKSDTIRKMVEKTALMDGSEPYHDEIYLNIMDGQVNLLGSSAGNSAIAFNTFSDSSLDLVESDDEEGTGAILDVADFLSYFDFASDGKTVELRFEGNSGELASALEIEGNLLSRIMLPVSESVEDKIPLGIVNRFVEGERWEGNNVFVSGEGNEPDTQIRAKANVFNQIVDAAEYHDKEFFPITVDDDNFRLDIGGEDKRNLVQGNLPVDEVGGEDVYNEYLHGFPELFSTVAGEVVVRLSDGAPVSVVKENDGYVLRHVLAPVQ